MKNYTIGYKGNDFYINDTKINNDIFDKELVDYKPEEKENFIFNLTHWISECTNSDKSLMLEDLKYIIKAKERDQDYFFSSVLTNEYILKSDDEIAFNQMCEDILKLNN